MLATIVVALTPTLPLAADTAATAPERELLLFEEPVVVAAAKRLQPVASAPSSVTIVTAEEIRRFGYRTLAEALRSVPGFYTTYDRNYSYLGSRGFLRPGDFNDRLLLLVNGHTYNDDVFQTAYLGPEFGIDLEAIERIEVIRGPGSALYGGNALFAVINVVTATADDRPGARAVVETGSFGRKRGQASIGHVFANGLDVLASGSVLDLDGQDELFYRELRGPESGDGIARNADGERALNFFLISRFRGFTLQGGINRRDKTIPTGSYGTTFGDTGTKTIDGRQFADLSYAGDVVDGLWTSARIYYDGVEYDGTYILGSGNERTKNKDLGPSHWLGGELRALREVFAGNVLTVGAEYSYHPSARLENFDLGGERYLDVDRSFGNWGVYAQDEWSPLEGVTVVGGLRFDRAYDDDENVSPRAAILWNPLDRTTLKLLYGEAFRAANLFERYYASPAGLGILASEDLDPERVRTYEAVLEQAVANGVKLSASLYHYEIRDLIDQAIVEREDGELIQFRNLTSARATGGEIELRAALPRDARFRASYSAQDARAKGGERLSNSPRHLGYASLLFPLVDSIEAGSELVIGGPRRTLDGRQLSTVTLLNLNLTAKTPIPGLDASVGLYNVLNQRYSDPAGNEHTQDRIPQDRFTFRVVLGYSF